MAGQTSWWRDSFYFPEAKKMVPIFMLKDAQSRFVKDDDVLRKYLRTEYGNPDSSWIEVEQKSANGEVDARKPANKHRLKRSHFLDVRTSRGEGAKT